MGTEDYDYSYLFEYVSKDKICNRYRFWYEKMLSFLKEAQLEKIVRIDRRKLGYAILSYYADVYRIIDFHKMEKINTVKIYAYSAYWLLRMAPLQLVDDVSDKYLHINEKFVTSAILSNIIREKKVAVDSFEDDSNFKQFAELLYYNFVYRLYSAQTLEVALMGVFAGIELGKSCKK